MAIKDCEERDSVSKGGVSNVRVLHGSAPSLHASCNVADLKHGWVSNCAGKPFVGREKFERYVTLSLSPLSVCLFLSGLDKYSPICEFRIFLLV